MNRYFEKLNVKSIFLGSLLVVSMMLVAQEESIISISSRSKTRQENVGRSRLFRLATTNDTLSLPFIDDFSYGNLPDTNLWINTGGVVLSHDFHSEPKSLYSATFDGWDVTGTPYDFFEYTNNSSSEISGNNDTLISKPIDLSLIDTTDGLELGFLYQRGGLSAALTPEDNDSLRVFFKDIDSNWVMVWPTPEYKNHMQSSLYDNSKFDTAYIAIDDTNFLHSGFQFKFESTGWTTVNTSLWSVNLVVLDIVSHDKSIGEYLPYDDAGYTEFPTRVLKDYTAVPIRQFMESPESYLNDSVSAHIKNSSSDPTQFSDADIQIRELNSGTILESIPSNISALTISGGPSIFPYEEFEMAYAINTDSISSKLTPLLDGAPLVLAVDYSTGFSSGTNLITDNDSVITTSAIDSYLAYDDGTAEVGYGIVGYGFFAMEFELIAPDTLTAINLQLIQDEFDYASSGRDLNIRIWKFLNGEDGASDDSVLYRTSYTVRYTEDLNEFDKILLENPILLPPGKFYIGYQQVLTEDQSLHIGYDLNNDNRDKIFIKSYESSVWYPSETGVGGSVMIRPYFGERGTLLNINAIQTIADIASVYPNPANDYLSFDTNIDHVEIFSNLGLPVFSENNILVNERVEVSNLDSGIYFVKIAVGDRSQTIKIIIL